MRPIRRFVSFLTLAAVAATLFVSLPFNVKHSTATAMVNTHFVAIDLIGPPQDPAIAAVMSSAPAGKLDYVAALGSSQTSLALHNTEIAGVLHAAGMATHSQPRAQAKV